MNSNEELIAGARRRAGWKKGNDDGTAVFLEKLADALEKAERKLPPCDGGCNYNSGPEETCSLHGRPVAEVWGFVQEIAAQRDEAERKIAAAHDDLGNLPLNDSARMVVTVREVHAALSTPAHRQEEPVGACEAFAWIGQPFSSCDKCGKPYWGHSHRRGVGDEAGTLVPIAADEAARVKAKWGKR